MRNIRWWIIRLLARAILNYFSLMLYLRCLYAHFIITDGVKLIELW